MNQMNKSVERDWRAGEKRVWSIWLIWSVWSIRFVLLTEPANLLGEPDRPDRPKRPERRPEGRYTLGMRSVLLIIKVPDRTNSKDNGCRSHGPMVHVPQ